ncbi:hypothetical protein V5P93_000962 [Actinokineospora auranticolor]|uniref:Uncharacterized protein n=1 Tax=Actinokineospora auranticolor TaxID=155976 RepID=A0A2S6GYB5_9PSEU|nr:hypothetical protein [Actinokineospora auranticolor]PPK70160.1 hypothetical protein CLV40_10270 [Actinokineospora auranticolor]
MSDTDGTGGELDKLRARVRDLEQWQRTSAARFADALGAAALAGAIVALTCSTWYTETSVPGGRPFTLWGMVLDFGAPALLVIALITALALGAFFGTTTAGGPSITMTVLAVGIIPAVLWLNAELPDDQNLTTAAWLTLVAALGTGALNAARTRH